MGYAVSTASPWITQNHPWLSPLSKALRSGERREPSCVAGRTPCWDNQTPALHRYNRAWRLTRALEQRCFDRSFLPCWLRDTHRAGQATAGLRVLADAHGCRWTALRSVFTRPRSIGCKASCCWRREAQDTRCRSGEVFAEGPRLLPVANRQGHWSSEPPQA